MSRYLSIRPVFDDAGLHGLERGLASPIDGELVVLAGGATVLTPYALAGLRAMIDAERQRGEHVSLELPRDGPSMRRFVASGIPPANLLFLEVPGPGDDVAITEGQVVHLEPGQHYYDMPPGNFGS
jgi:hypothetical protein